MREVEFTRVVVFSAAHRYFRPDWSSERNADVFGPYAGEHGHGHRYECHVTVAGPMADDTNMVIDLQRFDALLHREITERFDHRHINYDVPEFAFGKTIPTVEALAVYIWERVTAGLPDGVRLACVRLYEDPQLYAEYRGES
jgi:6-pyruvoyltetrahydropterin/6-carboxytetrahydropterin synthase